MGERPQKQNAVRPGFFMGKPVTEQQFKTACKDIGVNDDAWAVIDGLFDAPDLEVKYVKGAWDERVVPVVTRRMHHGFDVFKEVEAGKRDVGDLTDDFIDQIYYDLCSYGYIVAYVLQFVQGGIEYPYVVSGSVDDYRRFVRSRYGGLSAVKPKSETVSTTSRKSRFEPSRYDGTVLNDTRSVKVSRRISDSVEHIVKTKIDSGATWQDITDGIFAFVAQLNKDPQFVPSPTVFKIIEYLESNQPAGDMVKDMQSSLESLQSSVESMNAAVNEQHKDISSEIYALQSISLPLLADKIFGVNVGIDKLAWDKDFMAEVKPNRSEKSLAELRSQWLSMGRQGFEDEFNKKN